MADFRGRDFILKAAGVPLDSPFISEAKKQNIPIMMSTAWFSKIVMARGAILVGITGTRGKSTTTHLIHHILRGHRPRVFLGGNVKGMSTLKLLPNVRAGDVVVLELDSWQLQGFGDLKISPQVAVFTNFMPDHLNYYQGSMKKYFADKSNIFKFQKKEDKLFWGDKVPSSPKGWKLKLLGEHNMKNVALAIAVAKYFKVPQKEIKLAVENFKGVPGRLELAGRINGIAFYNDTTATTPAATLAALRSVSKNRNVVLIMGGADKNIDMSDLVKNLGDFCKKIVLLPGTGTEKIRDMIVNKVGSSSLKGAVDLALSFAKKGDVILFSPAFASFGLFKNEFDRGDQFMRIVKSISRPKLN